MVESQKTGVIGVFALVLSMIVGGSLYFSPSELESTYICSVNEEVGVFLGGISSTGYSAYPEQESKTGRVYCLSDSGEKGKWLKIEDYLDSKNISIQDFLTPQIEEEQTQIEEQNDIVETVQTREVLCYANRGGCVEK